MDENVFIKKSTLTSIGDAIRSKEGSTELIPPLEMPARIEAISGGVNFDTIVEVEENSFTNAAEVCEYFKSKHNSSHFLAILLTEVDGTNNQCIAMVSRYDDKGIQGAYLRLRDGLYSSGAVSMTYDCAIVPGTKYGVLFREA